MGAIAFSTGACTDARCAERAHQLVAIAEQRDLIGMAKGLLMATHGCDPDEAFELLRTSSHQEGGSLSETAERIVAEHQPWAATA